jgi:hypothetical protein
MQTDPVIEEVRRVRQTYAEQFEFNLRALADDLKKKERKHPELVVSLAPKPVRRRKTV